MRPSLHAGIHAVHRMHTSVKRVLSAYGTSGPEILKVVQPRASSALEAPPLFLASLPPGSTPSPQKSWVSPWEGASFSVLLPRGGKRMRDRHPRGTAELYAHTINLDHSLASEKFHLSALRPFSIYRENGRHGGTPSENRKNQSQPPSKMPEGRRMSLVIRTLITQNLHPPRKKSSCKKNSLTHLCF